eukprot:CAMPEP_0194219164 /NCGR_PEP_ID=MMETSP0156-20130528/25329_1 /TAXON_ID=33649 /ORGANISM="Thalassionema nitzschioides, Strain L26-B" /LENGTH=1176 /DNA_ID=CAMNT_0038948731 /DNA_START=151 /DNA_END=3681 /DNA_ORIENTATION=-
MLILLTLLVSLVLLLLALFAYAPIFCSCVLSLLYTLYFFVANEEHGVHHAQESENRFWTIFAVLLATVVFFAKDSPIPLGNWSPSLGFVSVVLSGYAMHTWDRIVHRRDLSRQVSLRRAGTATSSLTRLKDLGIPVEDQLKRINGCLAAIDKLLIPSTINNYINQRFVMSKEREIISIFEECDARALNYLVSHVKLGLLFYKIKDHNNFNSQHRSEIIQLLAVVRLPILTVMSRVIVLHALQLMKLRANPRAEYWVRNVILNTHQDDLSELKTLTDAKGDYFCMNKLIHDDIKSETTRQEILTHIRKEAIIQQNHVLMRTKKKKRKIQSWRKVLSDVDDTLCSSGGSYPAGIDKRYPKKVVYPGVLAFYRELDLGTEGPSQWPENRVGNLVFLSARPHVYKDVSEKINHAKFARLRVKPDGRQGLHTTPSLLAGDLASGTEYMMRNDMEPLALKKFDNFKRYVAIYPEYRHCFVCDNGQGDVRAGEMMLDAFPYEFEALYVHVVKDVSKTHGYAPERWREKGLNPCFFRTYPEAALDATKRSPPLIRIEGLRRVCEETVQDFISIENKKWQSHKQAAARRMELNQNLWEVNNYITSKGLDPVPMIKAEQVWSIGEKVRTPYGIARIVDFDSVHDLYEVKLDWRPLTKQLEEHLACEEEKREKKTPRRSKNPESSITALETVVESEEHEEERGGNVEPKNKKVVAVSMLTPPDKRPDKVASGQLRVGMETFRDSIARDITLNDSYSDSINYVKAKVQSALISKYTPPILPTVRQSSNQLFSFWTPKSEPARKVAIFKAGEQCKTMYGLGIVEDYEEQRHIVIVKLVGWNAKAFLNEESVEIVSKGIFESLFGPFGSVETTKLHDFPHAEGTVIKTPFGEGKVVRPSPASTTKFSKDEGVSTIGISLTNWTLGNNSHPVIYCTVETAQEWKSNKGKESKTSSDGILSAFGNLLSKPFRGSRALSEKRSALVPAAEQYYKDGAAVSTSFGPGLVKRFREEDEFYEVALMNWKLANGCFAKAILRRDGISHRLAAGCIEGYSVLTDLGLSGTLASVDPTTGVHIVTIPSAGLVCYLQPDSVVRPLKAAVGEEVLTAYGDGKMFKYHIESDTYEIALTGWNAKLYAKAETFDRAGDGTQIRTDTFGINWLLNKLFFSSDKSVPETTRSRSNSVVSARSTTK